MTDDNYLLSFRYNLIFLILLNICAINSEPPSLPPNIIIILMDDGGFADISPSLTPHIDSIRVAGANFLSGYVSAPQCSPSRVGLLTGRYQQRYGHETNDEFTAALSINSTKIIPQLLPDVYRSAMIGKWNLGDIPNDPLKHGFHHSYLYRSCDSDFLSLHRRDRSPKYANQTTMKYNNCTSSMFLKAESFIRDNPAHPKFLYLSPMSPHQPLVFPKEYKSYFNSQVEGSLKHRLIRTMVKEFDDGVGTVLRAIKEQGSDNNTIVIFLNDNGSPMNFSNFPLRGYKGDLYEGGIRVKFYMKWPGNIAAETVISDPISSLDILPTLINLIDSPSNRYQSSSFDGLNLYPLFIKTKGFDFDTKHLRTRMLFWRFNMLCRQELKAIRSGNLKWIVVGGNSPQLYNLSNDISESNNIADFHPDVMKNFNNYYSAWSSQLAPIANRARSQFSDARCK